MKYGLCARAALISAALALAAPWALAAGGKLLLTGGVSSLDGAAGGGLTPWAVTGSYATTGQWGATAHTTVLRSRDYALASAGVLLSWNDRIELSLAHQDFDTRDNLASLDLKGLHLRQNIVGAKLRLSGDAVLDSDRWMPQIAVGVLGKRADPGALGPALFGPLGAKRSGTELYVSATKLVLVPGLLVNATLRSTRANQNGLLGFGGARAGSRRLYPELSLAWLASPRLVFGAEWRSKPDQLNRSALGDGALKEDDWADLFVVWAPDKTLSLTAAVVDLGRIVPGVQPRRQTAAYLSAQLAF